MGELHMVHGVVVHETGSNYKMDRSVKEIRDAIRKWHKEERGWRDIGYHYVIHPHTGRAATGRPITQTGAHACCRSCLSHTPYGDYNSGTLGIAIIGVGESLRVIDRITATIGLCGVMDSISGSYPAAPFLHVDWAFYTHHELMPDHTNCGKAEGIRQIVDAMNKFYGNQKKTREELLDAINRSRVENDS